jgi:hypothetical protein
MELRGELWDSLAVPLFQTLSWKAIPQATSTKAHLRVLLRP